MVGVEVGEMGHPTSWGHAGPCQLPEVCPCGGPARSLPQNPLETTSLSFIIAVSESCSGFRSSSYDREPGRRRSGCVLSKQQVL